MRRRGWALPTTIHLLICPEPLRSCAATATASVRLITNAACGVQSYAGTTIGVISLCSAAQVSGAQS